MKHISIILIFLLLCACSSKDHNTVTREFVGPASGYSQAVVTTFNGVKTIHISGQLGEGDDLATQMKGALKNIERILVENGASFDDIVKMNHYIVDYKPEDLEVFRSTRKEVMGDENMPASTLVGVTSLFASEYIIEIDAIAVAHVAL